VTRPTVEAAGAGVSGTGNLNPAYPATVHAGDIAWLVVSVRDTSTTPTTPSGFTAANTFGANSVRGHTYWKRCTGSEGGTTVSVTIGGTVAKSARIYIIHGAVSTVTPFEGGGGNTGATAAIAFPAAAPSGDERLAVGFLVVSDDNALVAQTGQAGGTWQESFAEFTFTDGSDGAVQMQHASDVTNGVTLGGGNQTMAAADGWAVRTYFMIPALTVAPDLLGGASSPAPTVDVAATLTIAPDLLGGSAQPAILVGPPGVLLAALGPATVPAPLVGPAGVRPAALGGATLQTPTITAGAATVAPALLGGATTPAPSVLPGNVNVAPALLGGASAATPLVGPPGLLVPALGPAAALSPTVVPGGVSVAPALLGGAILRTPLVGPPGVLPALLGTATIQTPTVIVAGSTVAPALLGGATNPTPTFVLGNVNVAPALLGGATNPAPLVGPAGILPARLGGATAQTPTVSPPSSTVVVARLGGASIIAPTFVLGNVNVAPALLGPASALAPLTGPPGVLPGLLGTAVVVAPANIGPSEAATSLAGSIIREARVSGSSGMAISNQTSGSATVRGTTIVSSSNPPPRGTAEQSEPELVEVK